MSSTFGGLNTARTALWAAQRGLDVTGQNIANINTDGYSRQRVELRAMGGTAVPAIHSVSSPVGNGVDADQVIRIRDVFLERRGQVESARTAELTAGSEALARVEASFREPGDTGIRSMLDDVWAGFSALANTQKPQEVGARTQVLQRLDTLAAGFRTTAASLDQQWQQTRDTVVALAEEVNAASASIADLNNQIRQAVRSGLPSNELSDRRDLLVVRLAETVGATTVPASDGMVDVIVGGTTLVAGGATLDLRVAGADSPGGVGGVPRLQTDPGDTTLPVGGTAGGQLAVLSTTLPSYRRSLDALANDLVQKLNAVQAQGWDANGDPGAAQLLMDDGAGNAADVNASNISLRLSDPLLLAAAATDPADIGGQASADGLNAEAFFALSLEEGGVDATYRALVVSLGVEASVAARDVQVQKVISTQVDAARESVSGVNLDEEMTTMMSFQHAYSAAARVVTAIDEALTTLMRTGLVGR